MEAVRFDLRFPLYETTNATEGIISMTDIGLTSGVYL